NMQIQRHVDDEICNTARIGRSDTDKTVELAQNDYTITAKSEKSGFEIKYDFTEDAVNICVLSNDDSEYVLPIVSQSGDSVELAHNEVIFKNTLSVSFNSEYTIDPAGDRRHFHPVGGFQYKHITFPVKAEKPLNIKIRINK
ncbi:MAG: hypothetical protein IJZ63_08025, partial [Clostridia bacterium]|nr:hypothetical protein [Clostridia bacterium]